MKKINNNFALALDSKGERVIVEGKGIGFIKMPYELTDYSRISRTYYDYDDKYVEVLNDIPFEIIEIANEVFAYITTHIDCDINQNLPFILADHINFTIHRLKKNIVLKLPMYYDLLQMYPFEYEASNYALELIKKRLGFELPPEEKSGIILNIINAEMNNKQTLQVSAFNEWITQFITIIEEAMMIKVDKESFNYTRFVGHINYLYKRIKENKSTGINDNVKMYHSMSTEFPKVSGCVEKIADYLQRKEHVYLNEEEKLYLILHVNRLCNRGVGL